MTGAGFTLTPSQCASLISATDTFLTLGVTSPTPIGSNFVAAALDNMNTCVLIALGAPAAANTTTPTNGTATSSKRRSALGTLMSVFTLDRQRRLLVSTIAAADLAIYTATTKAMDQANTVLQPNAVTGGATQTSAPFATGSNTATATRSTITNLGGKSVTFPSTNLALVFPTTFTAFCTADTTCKAQSSLILALNAYTNVTVFSAVTTNWGTGMLADTTATSVKAVSPVVDMQLSYLSSPPPLICNSTYPCSAVLTFPLGPPLSGAYDATQKFSCLRLEPLSGSLTANYTGATTGAVNSATNTITCTTTRYGKHVIVQYTAPTATNTNSGADSGSGSGSGGNSNGTGGSTTCGSTNQTCLYGGPIMQANVSFPLSGNSTFATYNASSSLMAAFTTDVLTSMAAGLPSYFTWPGTYLSRCVAGCSSGSSSPWWCFTVWALTPLAA